MSAEITNLTVKTNDITQVTVRSSDITALTMSGNVSANNLNVTSGN